MTSGVPFALMPCISKTTCWWVASPSTQQLLCVLFQAQRKVAASEDD